MSSAFVREGDEMWLHEIPPTVDALRNYLTRENGGLPISIKSNQYNESEKAEVYKMSDGFSYAVKEGHWVCLD